MLPFLKFLQSWLPPLLWMFLIFSGSSDGHSYQHSSSFIEPLLHWLFPGMPLPRIQTIHYFLRKGAHMAEYAFLAGLLWRAIRQPPPPSPRPWNWGEAGLALGVVFLYAASDELHQCFVPGRTGQASDVAVDVTGAAAGLALLWAAKLLLDRRRRARGT